MQITLKPQTENQLLQNLNQDYCYTRHIHAFKWWSLNKDQPFFSLHECQAFAKLHNIEETQKVTVYSVCAPSLFAIAKAVVLSKLLESFKARVSDINIMTKKQANAYISCFPELIKASISFSNLGRAIQEIANVYGYWCTTPILNVVKLVIHFLYEYRKIDFFQYTEYQINEIIKVVYSQFNHGNENWAIFKENIIKLGKDLCPCFIQDYVNNDKYLKTILRSAVYIQKER